MGYCARLRPLHIPNAICRPAAFDRPARFGADPEKARHHRCHALARRPGAVASRDLKSIDLSRNIAVLRYDTMFAHKASAVETVTLVFENGAWSVTGYCVNWTPS
jgi:hypothetical protein